MNIGRGLQSSATCSDGLIFTIGGSWNGGYGGKNGEIYDPHTNVWTLHSGALVALMLTNDTAGIFGQDNHAWLFAWMSSCLFQAGPSRAMNWYNIGSNGAQSGAGIRATDGDSMCGNAVMYDASSGKILPICGSSHYSDLDSTSNAHIITLPLANPFTNPVVTTIGNMNYPRSFANAVVLPIGQVFIAGGQTNGWPFSDVGSQLTPELWDQHTNLFTPMAASSIPRNLPLVRAAAHGRDRPRPRRRALRELHDEPL
jgi:galactose oxidase